MKPLKCSEERIVYAIRQSEPGTQIGDLCLEKQYAHLCASEPRRLQQVEEENSLPDKTNQLGSWCANMVLPRR